MQAPVKINTWLVPAILSTIFCCLPFGIVSIVFASKANSAAGSGNIQQAQEAARKAKIWFWVAFGCGIISMIVAILFQLFMVHRAVTSGEREMDRILANEIAYAKARSKVLADHIGKNWRGQRAVIITEPDIDQNKIAKAGLDAMQADLKAAGIDVTAVEALNIPKGTSEEPIPMEMALTAKVYNEIFNKYKNAGIFVILSQLPFEDRELIKMDCWKFDPRRTRIILVNGEIYKLMRAIQKGIVGAAIAMKNDQSAYDPDHAVPKDVQAAFDTRFILVTPANVEDIAAKNNDLFIK